MSTFNVRIVEALRWGNLVVEVLKNWKILVLLSKKSTFKVRIIETWAQMGNLVVEVLKIW